MQRRNVIRLTLAAAASGALIPATSFAGSAGDPSNAMAGGVFYTKAAPGRWRGKAASHSPRIEIERRSDSVSVRVSTGHEMKGFEHYIVKHILLDGNYDFLGEKMFDPLKEAAVSTFSLGAYSGPIYALSVCNKHDTWLSSEEV